MVPTNQLVRKIYAPWLGQFGLPWYTAWLTSVGQKQRVL